MASGMSRSLPRELAVRTASRLFQTYSGLAASEFSRCAEQTEASQVAVLRRLAAATARTEYGRRYGIDADADYAKWRELPVVDWPDLEPWITLERERPGALVADPVVQWVRSRCTHCMYKLVPYTAALKGSFSRALSLWGHDLVTAGLKLRTGYCYFEIDPPELRLAGDFADDSDYVSRPLARLMRQVLVVDPRIKELRSTEHFQHVLALSLIAAAKLEVISIWHPTRFVEMCDYIVQQRERLASELDDARVTCEGQVFELTRLSPERKAALLAGDLAALWPALKLVSSPAEHEDAPSAAALARHLPQARHQGTGLMKTEAPLTIPLAVAGGWVPLVNEIFYELESDAGSVCPLVDAQVGGEYTIIISQAAGLARYRTGERVRVTHRWRSLPCLLHIV